MPLADHLREGGDYLKTGWHDVRITGVKMIDYGDGGVEYELSNKSGKTKVAFWFGEKRTWVLANFAKACGLTMDDMSKFNETAENHHKKFMVGRDVRVYVAKGEKGYHEVPGELECWAEFGAETDYTPTLTYFKVAAPDAKVGVPQTDEGVTDPEDIPF